MPQGRTPAVARESDAPSTSKGGSTFALSTTETHRQRFENSWGGCGDLTREARTQIANDALRTLHHARRASAPGHRPACCSRRGCRSYWRWAPLAASSTRPERRRRLPEPAFGQRADSHAPAVRFARRARNKRLGGALPAADRGNGGGGTCGPVLPPQSAATPHAVPSSLRMRYSAQKNYYMHI
eukprot:scaffold61712_cov69-Phaeocystis_antarctica.AAC.20